MRIRLETPADTENVEHLYDLVFGHTRVFLGSYRLRRHVSPLDGLCMVALDQTNDCIIAAIRYWPVYVKNRTGYKWPSLLLGPIAVHPTAQGEGIGHQLICTSLALAAQSEWERVFLVGDAPYYVRFGFSVISKKTVQFPKGTNPARSLAKPLVADGLLNVSGKLVPWHLP